MARTRYSGPKQVPLRALPAAALRAVFREGYPAHVFKSDVLAGLVVGLVALPLAMALAIGVGVPPQHGLYTAILAGFLVALLGGSRTQVTGPTAAFIVILAPLFTKYGMAGLLLCGLLGGIILILMGLMRLGRLIEFIPHPVTTGFTAGIAVVIAGLQLKDFLGLSPGPMPEHFLERMQALWAARHTAALWECGIGSGTLAVLLLFPRITRKVPAPLVALPLAALAALLLERWVPALELRTIARTFHTTIGDRMVDGIPQLPPLPMLPWLAPGPGGEPLALNLGTLRLLLPGAFAVAMLGAIESLLSAVVSDGMAGTRHDPDAELLALGVGNVVTPFFGGIPATGAIARTATNIRSGARSPVAAMVHALVILTAVLALAPLIGHLPMAALAALLLLVAWNMSELKHFKHILKVAPRSDVTVLLTCFGLTVVFDMVIAVGVGIVLAALLFMHRMAEVTQTRLFDRRHPHLDQPLPEDVMLYDISGPLFFGAAQEAVSALGTIDAGVKAVIFRMDGVPAMDITGLVAFESALEQLRQGGCLTVLVGLQPQPLKILEKAGIKEVPGKLVFERDLDKACEITRAHLGS